MPSDQSVTRKVKFTREYTFMAEANMAKMHLDADQGSLATMQPKMSDYRLSLKSVDSAAVGESNANNRRPTLTVEATVAGAPTNIDQWLNEIDKRYTIHTEMSDSEQLREYHKSRKSSRAKAHVRTKNTA